MDVAQSKGYVDEHDGIADHNSADVAVALSVDLVLNAALCAEGYSQVGVAKVLHKPDEPEMDTHTHKIRSLYT